MHFAFRTGLDVWLDTVSDDYNRPMPFATFLDWFFGKLDALGADALKALRALAQHNVSGSHPELYQSLANKSRINTEPNGSVFQVFAGAMARPDEKRRPSSLHSLRGYPYEMHRSAPTFALPSPLFSAELDLPGPEVASLPTVFAPMWELDSNMLFTNLLLSRRPVDKVEHKVSASSSV